jgi:O-succinylhomoserine sulfhydrylase
MGAILLLVMGLLKAGDHVICSRSVFGSTIKLLRASSASSASRPASSARPTSPSGSAAVKPNTRLLFAETPTNPLTEVCDIRRWPTSPRRRRAAGGGQLLLLAGAAAAHEVRRRLVMHSGTKYLDGQGRVIAGALCGSEALVNDKFVPVMRSAGMSLSPFNAWVVLKGLETLSVRMEAQSERALELARWLEGTRQVARVYYPGLPSHPQHALAMAQQSGSGGAVVSFRREGGARRRPSTSSTHPVCSIAANLGDTKTIITHPASTSHGRLTEAQRQAAGITQGMIRLGRRAGRCRDLKADLRAAWTL